MTDRPAPGDYDDPDDDGFDDDPFADYQDERVGAGRADEAADPFDVEPVLDGEDLQNTPNSYNVRNIVLIASGGFVLVLVAFLFSLGGSDDPGRLQVNGEATRLPVEATPPDITQRPDAYPTAPANDDLTALLEDPALSAGGYGTYTSTEPPPPQTRPRSAPAASAGDRPPTYRELRREAFLAALGRSTARTGSPGEAPATAPGGGYVVDEAGNVYALAGGGLGDGGLVQPAVQRAPSAPAAAGATAGMRQATTQAQPRFSTSTLAQGTLVNVVLETAVHSDTPGLVTFRTTEDVYDRHRRAVLVPRGSQVVAQTGGVMGDRLLVDAIRLNLPDGRSVDFSEAALHDAQGRMGLADLVDRHTLSRVGAGALQAATGVASTVAGRRAGRSTVVFRNPDGTTSEVPIGDDVEDEALRRGTGGAERAVQSATERALSRPNTVRLRPGLRAVVVFRDDVDLGAPYYPGGAVPVGRSPFDVRPPATRRAGVPAQPGAPRVPPPPPARTTVRTVGTQR